MRCLSMKQVGDQEVCLLSPANISVYHTYLDEHYIHVCICIYKIFEQLEVVTSCGSSLSMFEHVVCRGDQLLRIANTTPKLEEDGNYYEKKHRVE